MKRLDVKAVKTIGGSTYYIRPFGAFKAANVFGQVSSALLPVLGAALPALGGKAPDAAGLFDMDASAAAPAIGQGLSSLDGGKAEAVFRSLLCAHGNVSVEEAGGRDAAPLTEDLADELFCGDFFGMCELAFEVLKANYEGFFRKAGALFGNAPIVSKILRPASENTAA